MSHFVFYIHPVRNLSRNTLFKKYMKSVCIFLDPLVISCKFYVCVGSKYFTLSVLDDCKRFTKAINEVVKVMSPPPVLACAIKKSELPWGSKYSIDLLLLVVV